MKLASLILLIFAFTTGYSQYLKKKQNEVFFLRGKVIGRDTGYIILRYTNSFEKWITDTTFLKKGKFEFTGKINQPTSAVIKGYPVEINFNEVNFVNFFLEPGQQHVLLVENDYENIKMEGSKTQNEYDILKKKIDSVNHLSKNLSNEVLQAKKDAVKYPDDSIKKEKFDNLFNKLKPTFKTIEDVTISFISGNPNSYVSPYFLAIYLNSLPVDSAKLLYTQFTNRIQKSRSGKWVAEEINKKKQNSPGALAPNIKIEQINGQEISLSKLRGNIILLDFWASWCIPCRESIPGLKTLFNQYHSKGFEIVTISIDKKKADWEKAVEEEEISNWKNVLANEEINKNYGNVNQPIPSQILIDTNGIIIWPHNGTEQKVTLNEKLSEIFK
ncbi:MAG: TlpA disulfide reductase family protein [Ginsengibacter sp.]